MKNIQKLKKNLDEAIDIANNIQKNIKSIKKKNELLYLSPEQTGRLNIDVDYRSDF